MVVIIITIIIVIKPPLCPRQTVLPFRFTVNVLLKRERRVNTHTLPCGHTHPHRCVLPELYSGRHKMAPIRNGWGAPIRNGWGGLIRNGWGGSHQKYTGEFSREYKDTHCTTHNTAGVEDKLDSI